MFSDVPARRLDYDSPGRHMRVLVVEDEQKVGDALQEGLTGEGAFYRVRTEA